MNLKEAIKQLNQDKKTSCPITLNGKKHELFRCPVFSKKNAIVDYHYYLLKEDELIGEGGTAKVFLSYPIDTKSYKVNYKKRFVAKIFADKKKFTNSEAAISSRYYQTEMPIEEGKRIILFNEYLGEELITDRDELHRQIKKLSIQKRINLICQILLNLNLLHHNTPNTGRSIIHSDIKGSNILIHDKNSILNASICDFGFSNEIDDDSSLLMHIKDMAGSPGHLSPELMRNRKQGLKSDIYSLLPVILMTLGATQVFKNKSSLQTEWKNDYDFTGIFKNYPIPPYIQDVQEVIIKFLKRWQNQEYTLRPDSDEALRFFTTLQNYCGFCKIHDNESKYIAQAKLILLASGCWNHVIGERSIEKYKSNIKTWQFVNTKTVEKTYEHYDFLENPSISEALVFLYKNEFLQPSFSKELFAKNNPLVAESILVLGKNKHLTSQLLNKILFNYSNNNLKAIKILSTLNLLDRLYPPHFSEDQSAAIQKLHALHLLDDHSLKEIRFTTIFAKNINRLTEKDCHKLTQLMNIAKKNNVSFNVRELKNIITSDGISITEAFKASLNEYRKNRSSDKRGKYFHFWSRLTGHDCETKCKAIDEMIEILDKNRSNLTPLADKALKNGRVKNLITEFNRFALKNEQDNLISLNSSHSQQI